MMRRQRSIPALRRSFPCPPLAFPSYACAPVARGQVREPLHARRRHLLPPRPAGPPRQKPRQARGPREDPARSLRCPRRLRLLTALVQVRGRWPGRVQLRPLQQLRPQERPVLGCAWPSPTCAWASSTARSGGFACRRDALACSHLDRIRAGAHRAIAGGCMLQCQNL